MRIDEARHDGSAAYVEHFGTRWHTALRAYALDAVVFDDDLGVFQNFIAFHRHDGRSAQDDCAFRCFPWEFQIDGDLLDVLLLLLQFLFFFFLFRFFAFLRISRLRSGILLVRILGVSRFLVAVFFFGVLLFVFWRFERDGTQRLSEKARADRPGDGLAPISPRELIRADV